MKRMLASLALLLGVTLARAEAVLDLPMDNPVVKSGKVSLSVALPQGSGEKREFFLEQEGGEKLSLGGGQTTPMNLWVLVDVSALCRAREIDTQVNQALRALKENLHPESLLSLVSYTDSSLEIHANHQAVKSTQDYSLLCQAQSRSSSHERAIRHLMKSKEATELPTVAWVISSGNAKLSPESLAEMRNRRIETQLSIYNLAVKKEVLPTLTEQKTQLGESLLTVNWVDKKLQAPAIKYALQFYPPFAIQGKKSTLRLSASADGKQYASAPFNINLPDSKMKVFWLRYGRYLGLLILVVLLTRLVLGLKRYYSTQECERCHKLLRVSDKKCGFCREEGEAYLIGNFNHKEKEKMGKYDVMAVAKNRVELGTHSRSGVRLIRPPQMKKRQYAVLHSESLENGKRAFRLERHRLADLGSVRVNQQTLKESRYLNSGDKIEILGQEVGFYVEGRAQ